MKVWKKRAPPKALAAFSPPKTPLCPSRPRWKRVLSDWIKAARLLAMRRDIFSKVFCDELSKLHDRAIGFPGQIAIQILEEDLKAPLRAFFREFDVVPVAAASIGQVHRARLLDGGHWVAIKVQRPAIEEAFRKDLEIIAAYIKFLRLFPSVARMELRDMYLKLESTLADELDYRMEASSIRRMRHTLKREKVYAPKVFGAFTTKRVLVMEFIPGVLVSDYIHARIHEPKKAKKWRKENKIRPKKLGNQLYPSYLRQLLSDNLSHGDLHPSNVMMLRNNWFALIGSIRVLDEDSCRVCR
ncbi:AarF/ABC1/UbiB kinase family protein [Polyangium sp. 15x6]|uniref:ABC1 kinase family protein n=1 Tax=Polyangium sp. 15x6 TaxID=3042687 RepID=UPI00249B12A4|nr:AarF/ABC1/UbiB kinase family protein [Polyangium sp. 15x6]MDI3284232.1 AarF/ABC1/UbiB kinase family protein [Polyangium sp. 15x6]